MFAQTILAAALFATSGLAQCPKYSAGYVCSDDLTEVIYCQPDETPTSVVSQYCGGTDCQIDDQTYSGFCYYGITVQNAGRGPTSCDQVYNGYICSEDYTQAIECVDGYEASTEICGRATCWASTNGDNAACL